MLLKRRKYVHETQFTNCGRQEKGWDFQRRKGEHSVEGKGEKIKKEIPVVRIATMNIRGSSENKIEILTETMENSHIDITIVTETRNKWRTTRNCRGYNIVDTKAGKFGGVAIIYRNSGYYQIEEVTIVSKNIITCEIESGYHRWHMVGVYMPLEINIRIYYCVMTTWI